MKLLLRTAWHFPTWGKSQNKPLPEQLLLVQYRTGENSSSSIRIISGIPEMLSFLEPAVGTHGTGVGLGSLATQVIAMRIILASGQVLSISQTENAGISSMPSNFYKPELYFMKIINQR